MVTTARPSRLPDPAELVLPPSAPGDGQAAPPSPRLLGAIDRFLGVQRPVVLAHVRATRSRHPEADPETIVRLLERHYVVAVTSGGAAVGASSAVPGIGIAASLALSGAETVGFLETSALFAQSVTEVHGLVVTDPERARALVLTMMLGTAGSDLVRQLAGQVVGTGPARSAFWGELIVSNLPQQTIGPIVDRLGKAFVRRFATRQAGSVIGRAIPFGVGAVIGGVGNHVLARRIVTASRTAFGPAPAAFPAELAPRVRLPRGA